MSDLEKLRELMRDNALDMAQAQRDSGNWAGWVISLLEALDDAAATRGQAQDFELTLAGMHDAIGTRLKTKHW